MARAEILSDIADAELAERAAAGDNPAFAELYRRHAEVAWRVGYAVTGNRDDAADAVSDAFTRVLQALPQGRLHDNAAFRGYLLTATRRAGIDCLRRRGRTEAGDVSGYATATVAGPTERMLDATDSALVAAAFKGLPERWRSVLWLTEVEQIPAKEAAPLLGLSPNGVAQLAVRARNGLRERYLQAHLRDTPVPKECQFTVDHLGAYVAGALPPRDLAKVDQHLAGCEACRARHAELEDLGHRLRRIVVPIPIGLGALAMKQWRHAAGFSPIGKLRKLPALAGKAERPLAVMSAALFAAGLAGVALHQPPPSPVDGPTAARAATAPPSTEAVPVPFVNAGAVDMSGDVISLAAEDPAGERRAAGSSSSGDGEVLADSGDGDLSGDVVVLPGDPGDPNDNGGGGDTPPPPPPAAPKAQLQITVSGGETTAAVAGGYGDNACTGGTLAGQSAGCTPPPPNSDAILTANTGGSELPAQEITVP